MMPFWFWCFVTLFQSAITVMQWDMWLSWKELEAKYPPDVLAAAHFAIPPGVLRTAIISTALVGFFWFRLIRSAER